MDNLIFDVLTRRVTDGGSRRADIQIPDTAGLTAASHPDATSAKKTRKVDKRCKRQVNPCKARLTALCGGSPVCPLVISCCDRLENCQFDSFFTCFFAAAASTPADLAH